MNERSFMAATERLLDVVVEECEESKGFTIGDGTVVRIYIDLNEKVDIEYKMPQEVFGRIKEKLKLILNQKKGK